jgi:hypothetical protein
MNIDKQRSTRGIDHYRLIKPPITNNTATRSTDHKDRHKQPGEDRPRRSGEGLLMMTTNAAKTASSPYNDAATGEGSTSPLAQD